MAKIHKICVCALAIISSGMTIACRSQAASQAERCRLVIKNAKSIMKKYDKDGDGRLSQTELRAMAVDLDMIARETNRKYGAEGGEDNLQMLEERDVNHDGYVDLSELAIVPSKTPGDWRSCL